MKNLAVLFCILTLAGGGALAQERTRERHGHGYGFFGAGGVNAEDSIAHFGFGGEGLLYKGIGIGAELGYLAPMRSWGYGIGLASLNGSYHFRRTGARAVPFVTGGASLAFREGFGGAYNFGGGVNYWFKERVGLRMEFRDHFRSDGVNVHFWEGRIGFLFR